MPTDTTSPPCPPGDTLCPETRPQTAPSTGHPRLQLDLPAIAIDTSDLHFSFETLREQSPSSAVQPLDDLKFTTESHVLHHDQAQVGQQSPESQSPPLSLAARPANRQTEARLPTQRRAPASRSSNGIETSFGPPPALITRRSYTSDIARRAHNPAQLAHDQNRLLRRQSQTALDRYRNEDINITARPPSSRAASALALRSNTSPLLLSPPRESKTRSAMADDVSSGGEDEFYDAKGQLQASSGGDTSGQSSDDLFLKLANNDNPQLKRIEDQNQLGRKLVRTASTFTPTLILLHRQRCHSLKNATVKSYTNFSQSRGRKQPYLNSPTHDSDGSQTRRNSSTHNPEYVTSRSSPLTGETTYPTQRRTSLSGASTYSATSQRNRASTSSEQRLNAYRSKYMAAASQSPSVASRPESASYRYRRPSIPESTYSRFQSTRPSKLQYSSNRETDLSSQGDGSDLRRTSVRAESRVDGAESVVSNSAQSAMWDELNELKSRLQKIEWADKPQPTTFSSGGTMSNGSNERPRTATTTVTTMSSSPKISKPGTSPAEGTIGGPAAANIHPMLHQSLARCKQVVSSSIYRSLETAASDALELAILTGATTPQASMLSSASIINGAVTDRQLRRKADNVCRSLTDLCISLCEGKLDLGNTGSPATFAQRPGSRGIMSSTNSPIVTPTVAYSRQNSLEPESSPMSRPAPSRALERVEARRASLMAISGNNSPRESGPPSVQLDSSSTAVATPSPREGPTHIRTGTSLTRTRLRMDDEDDDPSQRPISRATTDIGTSIRKRVNRLSGGHLSARGDREYTSQHPLPTIASNSTLPKPTPLRRVGGTTFNKEESNSAPSSLQRERTQKFLNRDGEPMYLTPEASTDEERSIRRRSLGLYSVARSSIGLGRKSSLSKRSVTAGGGGAD